MTFLAVQDLHLLPGERVVTLRGEGIVLRLLTSLIAAGAFNHLLTGKYIMLNCIKVRGSNLGRGSFQHPFTGICYREQRDFRDARSSSKVSNRCSLHDFWHNFKRFFRGSLERARIGNDGTTMLPTNTFPPSVILAPFGDLHSA